MALLLMLLGGGLSAFICSIVFDGNVGGAGFLIGAISGLLLTRLQKFRDRLVILEREVKHLRALQPASKEQTEPQAYAAPTTTVYPISVAPTTIPVKTSTAWFEPNTADSSLEITPSVDTTIPTNPSAPIIDTAENITASISVATVSHSSVSPPAPTFIDRGFAYLKRWFTEGNVPVKVGVLVLFSGVAALLKYAIDQDWVTFPIELRLAIIAAAALAGLIFAWSKRESHRTFALSLQGGAIGVLLLTVFAGFRLYSLLPASAAFALLIVLIAGTGALAVLQDSLALAFLGIVGGFLAPILVSTDNNNPIALFAYYAILNTAILGIAWIKSWRILNLTGFFFTFAIGTLWGVTRYQPELFTQIEPFLILFFFFYLTIPILYALRQPAQQRGLVDGTLVFGTPLLVFSLQAGLLNGDSMLLAYSALSAALIYIALGALLLRRLALPVLGESFVLLALGFATLAIPLALSAQSTVCAWAVEGAALVWLGLRQQRQLPRLIGCLLQQAAAVAYVINVKLTYFDTGDTLPIANGDWLGAELIALAGLTSAWLLMRARQMPVLAKLLFFWGLAWWLLAGLQEIDRFAPYPKIDWQFGFAILTAWLASELHRRWDWRECTWPAVALFPLSLILLIPMSNKHVYLLEDVAALDWLVWLVITLRIFGNLQNIAISSLAILHFLFLWTIAGLIGLEFAQLAQHRFSLVGIWIALFGLLPLATLFWLTLRRTWLVRAPVPAAADRHRPFLLGSLASVLSITALIGLISEGQAAPLPYLPLINPLELAQLLVVLLLLHWYRQASAEGNAIFSGEERAGTLALLGFAVLTSITLRSVHFLGGVAWDTELLFSSTLAQTCLSVMWSVAGIVAMVIGARRGTRGVWIGGATLMGLVIAKLVLVDRHHMHDLIAILGTLTVGLLLLIVGYFAPAPPRRNNSRGTA